MIQNRILILHKNPVILERLSQSLRTAGYSTVLASNAEDAYNLFNSMRPEIVLWGEPLTQHSKQMISKMTNSGTNNEVAIIAVSESRELFDRIAAQKFGVNDFVASFEDFSELKARIRFHQQHLQQIRKLSRDSHRYRHLAESNFNMMLSQDVSNLCEILYEYLDNCYTLNFAMVAVYNYAGRNYDYFNLFSQNTVNESILEDIARQPVWKQVYFSEGPVESEEISHPSVIKTLQQWQLEFDKVYQFPMQYRSKNLGILILSLQPGSELDEQDEIQISTLTQALAFRISEIRRMFGTRREGSSETMVMRDIFHRLSEDEIYIYLCRHLLSILQADRCLYMNYHEGFHFLYPKYLFQAGRDLNHFENEKPPVLLVRDYPVFEGLISERKPLILEQQDSERMHEVLSLPGLHGKRFRHTIILPLIMGNAIQGFFVLAKESIVKKYTRREIGEAEQLIKQATVSLNENRILKQANLTIKQLDRIFDLGTELTLDIPLKNILKKIATAIRRTLGWNIVILDMKRPYEDEFENVAVLGLKDSDYQKMIRKDEYPPFRDKLDYCFRMGNSFFYDHLRAYSQDPNESWQEFAMQIGAEWNDNDWLYVPIESRGDLMGMISLNDPVERRRPSVDRVKAIEYFANQAAVVMENTRLFESLRSSELKYRLLAETMTMGLVTCDFSGRIIYANQSLARLLGYSDQNELTGTVFYELCKAQSLPKLEKDVTSILDEEVGENGLHSSDGPLEIELISNEGEEIPFMVYTSPYFEHNVKIGFFAVLSDLRARKRLERLRSDFNSMIVHDLRSPLNIIQGYIDMVRQKVAGEVTPEQEEYLGIAKENVYKVLKLVDNFLTASKIEVGQFSIEPEVGSINDIIEDLYEQHLVLVRKKQINLEKELDANIPLLHFDKFRIEQVLTNFLSNAIKFTPEEGNIRITSKLKKKTKVLTGENEMYVEISVADSGVGISPEEQAKVFNKYEQTEASKNASLKGTGLGLAICREIIELHKGEIWVESEVNKGSVFSFTLPIQPVTILSALTKSVEQ